MTGCSVIGCRNRSEHGYLMKKFPSDVKRRAQWVARVRGNRENWEPKKSACICEVHFDPSMWEKDRVDGKRALKWNAVPTILEGEAYKNLTAQLYKSIPKKLLPILPKPTNKPVLLIPQSNSNISKPVLLLPDLDTKENEEKPRTIQVDPHHTYCKRFESPPDIKILDFGTIKKTGQNTLKGIPINSEKFHNYFSKKGKVKDTTLATEDWNVDDFVSAELDLKDPEDEIMSIDFTSDKNEIPMEFLLTDTQNLGNKSGTTISGSQLRKLLLNANPNKEKFILARMDKIKCKDPGCDRMLLQKERTIALLKKKIITLRKENVKMFKKMNQPSEALKKVFNEDQIQAMTLKKNTKWSSETIVKALELVISCGLKGYKELLKQNLPYPSIRTLQRKLDCDIS